MTGGDRGTQRLRIAMAPLPTPHGNPFIRQMATELRANGCDVGEASVRTAFSADVLHLHWPDHFVSRSSALLSARGALKVLLMASVMRLRGRAVVWTVHNLRPHESRHPRVEGAFWPAFTSIVSGCVYLSEAGRRTAVASLPRLAGAYSAVVPHGSYLGVYPGYEGSSAEARRSLGLPPESSPLLFFGQIRAYKNVPGLLEAFAAIDAPDARLVIAGGGPDADLNTRIAQAADADPRVVLTGRVEDDDVLRVTTACVGAVLPFHDVFNSGSLFLALSAGRPVLVPRTDVFAELQEAIGPGWIVFFEPPLDAADLVGFASSARALVETDTVPDLSAFDWKHLGPRIVELYSSLVASHGRRRRAP